MNKNRESNIQIKIFQPLQYHKKDFSLEELNETVGCKFQYASKGRFAIVHILRALGILNGKVLISAYICPTVAEALLNNGYSVDYYDIDIADLNPDMADVEKMVINTQPQAVVIPSLYGNPADLIKAEKIGKKYNVVIIDDAAQSFGAKLEGKYLSTFGDGGMFAFSPGKATAGSMGAFFCSKNPDYTIKRTKHFMRHYLQYLDFKWNRYNIYSNRFHKITQYIFLLYRFFRGDILNDDYCGFETLMFGGVLEDNIKAMNGFRRKYMNDFISRFSNNQLFRIVKPLRGENNPHKFVLIFYDLKNASVFRRYMTDMNIFTYGGYDLPNSSRDLPNCRNTVGKIVELPLEDNQQHMDYLFQCVDSFNYYIRENKK